MTDGTVPYPAMADLIDTFGARWDITFWPGEPPGLQAVRRGPPPDPIPLYAETAEDMRVYLERLEGWP